VTVAERALELADYPDAIPELLVPGSLVFRRTAGPVDLDDYQNWWHWVPGAQWRHPEGPGTTTSGRERHPVTHVAHEDATAYAAWAGKALPTEAEWELAARGGLDGAPYAWGDELMPGGRRMANTWVGDFPLPPPDGADATGSTPVGRFPPNGYGLHDMIGNVWEWTRDWYTSHHPSPAGKPCCIPADPRGGAPEESYDPAQPAIPIPRKVLKGGSFLCAPNYCRRYRPAARQPQMIDSAAQHIGFRCVIRPG
jgi:formylglycine-generating enzyme required for sulfatase activity